MQFAPVESILDQGFLAKWRLPFTLADWLRFTKSEFTRLRQRLLSIYCMPSRPSPTRGNHQLLPRCRTRRCRCAQLPNSALTSFAEEYLAASQQHPENFHTSQPRSMPSSCCGQPPPRERLRCLGIGHFAQTKPFSGSIGFVSQNVFSHRRASASTGRPHRAAAFCTNEPNTPPNRLRFVKSPLR